MRIVQVIGVGIVTALMLVPSAFAQTSGARYYAFSRPDLRKCQSPLCGGIFVKELNRPSTPCADGTLAVDCYVSGLDTSSLGVSNERAFAFNTLFMQGWGIVKGAFQPLTTPSPAPGISVLAAEEAWEGQGTAPEKGTSYLFRDNGVRCITEPCPSIDAEQINSGRTRQISGIDFVQTGAPAGAMEEGLVSLSTTGLIASGRSSVIQGPGGRGLQFVASRFYVKVQEGVSCGGLVGAICPQDQFCDVTVPNACTGADLSGICKTVPQICSMIVIPVCGCDGVTYSNDCARLEARVQLAHDGACAGTP